MRGHRLPAGAKERPNTHSARPTLQRHQGSAPDPDVGCPPSSRRALVQTDEASTVRATEQRIKQARAGVAARDAQGNAPQVSCSLRHRATRVPGTRGAAQPPQSHTHTHTHTHARVRVCTCTARQRTFMGAGEAHGGTCAAVRHTVNRDSTLVCVRESHARSLSHTQSSQGARRPGLAPTGDCKLHERKEAQPAVKNNGALPAWPPASTGTLRTVWQASLRHPPPTAASTRHTQTLLHGVP
jgi:hypothetical protein